MIDNRYGCPDKLWRKYTYLGKAIYNEMMVTLASDVHLPTGLKESLTEKQKSVLYHNMACEAAWTGQFMVRQVLNGQPIN